ncbi:MAG TPA: carboxypeptidase-like regulatory domain-containing protein [Longilinea sp.]|nr:carboxypeptidase-like regulatory domain-containing protein [Longilinea sp.]
MEKSPGFSSPDLMKDLPEAGLGGKRKRLLPPYLSWPLSVAFFIIAIALAVKTFSVQPAPGGLDGCFLDPDGISITGSFQVGDQMKILDQDGCFFFATLPPGTYTGEVYHEGALLWQESIQIQSGEATGLGTVLVTP